jgi:CHAT domain-containing protein
MKTFVTVTLAHHGLELRCPGANLSEDRPIAADDAQCLQGWARRYLATAGKDDQRADLLKIGQEMHAWLNGTNSFLTRSLEAATAPLLVEFAVSRQDCEKDFAQALLNAPWELLASDGEFWALQASLVYCPIRRIGKAGAPAQPSETRLGLVFMAAAPRGADGLDYESEEASILTATRSLGLDLAVEESGTLELLAACVAREQPEVVQISCHGTLHPQPGLLLEDDLGDAKLVSANQLVKRLAAQHPRLLFLSACETAQADPVLPSLARSLVVAGAPAVLGWAAPVLDREATLFAALLYESLTQGAQSTQAVWASSSRASHASVGVSAWASVTALVEPGGGGAVPSQMGSR